MTTDNVIKTYPPNYQDILLILGDITAHKPVFAYFPHIYNPFDRELPPDVLHHENVHLARQKDMGVDVWYNNYLSDTQFRLQEEVMAYGEQFNWAKENAYKQQARVKAEGGVIPKFSKMLDAYLDSLAIELSNDAYGQLISFGGAKSKIRNYAK